MKKYILFTAIALFAGLAFAPPASAQEVPERGSITIELDAKGNTHGRNFDFRFNPGADFNLKDNESVTRKGLRNDDYEVLLFERGWVITDVDCTGDNLSEVSWDEASVSIELNSHEDIECVVEIDTEDEPTPTPTVAPLPTTPVPPAPTPQVQTGCIINGQAVMLVGNVQCPAAPTPTAVPAQVVAVQPVSPIRPPATGSGGLLPVLAVPTFNAIGDDDYGYDGGGSGYDDGYDCYD